MEKVSLAEKTVVSEQRFQKQICFNTPQVLVFVLTFAPGQALPPHRHPGSTLVLQVTSGSGQIVSDGKESSVSMGDIALLAGEEEMLVRNTGAEPLVVLASLSPNPTNPQYAKEIK